MELVMLCLALHFFYPAAENDWSGYLLAIVCLIAAQIIARMMIKPELPPCLLANLLLMLSMFWVLATTGRQYHQLVYRSLESSGIRY